MTNQYTDEYLSAASKTTMGNKATLEKSTVCACYYCQRIFKPKEIPDWVEDSNGDTAICPYCNVDSVLGESSGFPLAKDFLQAMHKKYF